MNCPSCKARGEAGPRCKTCGTELYSSYANLGTRLAAAITDAAIVISLCALAILLGADRYLDGGELTLRFRGEQVTVGETAAWALGVWLLASLAAAICTALLGATPGKLLFRVWVANTRFERIGFGRALGRELLKALDVVTLGAGYLLALTTTQRQTLHDLGTSTIVLAGEPPPTGEAAPPLAIIGEASADELQEQRRLEQEVRERARRAGEEPAVGDSFPEFVTGHDHASGPGETGEAVAPVFAPALEPKPVGARISGSRRSGSSQTPRVPGLDTGQGAAARPGLPCPACGLPARPLGAGYRGKPLGRCESCERFSVLVGGSLRLLDDEDERRVREIAAAKAAQRAA